MPASVASPTGSASCPRGITTHPLEIIPLFRRFRRSVVRDIIYSVIWNSLFAVFFFAIGTIFDSRAPLWPLFRNNMIFAQCIGFSIYGGFLAGDRLFGAQIGRAGNLARGFYYAAIPVIFLFPGYFLALRLLGWGTATEWFLSARGLLSILLLALVITGLMLLIFIPRERAARTEAAMAQEQARVAAAEKEAATARMKLLEAQVEPHFLHNTLANVVSLIDSEPGTAKQMIERLITLLRATASSVTGDGSLGAQVALLRAYLEILQMRMGGRLAWRIDVPQSLATVRVPPMLLQPIVENAIKHGLEPALAGGDVAIAARRDGGSVVLTVSDTGRGFQEMAKRAEPGVGLANLRARLAATYGDAASLTIEDQAPRGTRVMIVLPVDPMPASWDAGAPALAAIR